MVAAEERRQPHRNPLSPNSRTPDAERAPGACLIEKRTWADIAGRLRSYSLRILPTICKSIPDEDAQAQLASAAVPERSEALDYLSCAFVRRHSACGLSFPFSLCLHLHRVLERRG